MLTVIFIISITIIGVGCKEEAAEEVAEESSLAEEEAQAEEEEEAMEEEEEVAFYLQEPAPPARDESKKRLFGGAEDESEIPIVDFMKPLVGNINSSEWDLNIRKAKEKFVIAYGTFSQGQLAYHKIVEAGVMDAAEKFGVEVFILDNELDAAKGIENTRLVIDRGVDFYINAQIHAETNVEIANMLEEAGIPAIGIDVLIPGFPFHGVNNYYSNYLGGEWLGSYVSSIGWSEDETYFVYIDQVTSGEIANLRREGAIDGVALNFSVNPENFQIIELEFGTIDATQEKIRAWLTANPQAEYIMVMGTQNNIALGALAALREAGREENAAVVGNGGVPNELIEIADPDSAFKATPTTSPNLYGTYAINMAVDYLEGKQIPADVSSPVGMITSVNVEDFMIEFGVE